MTDTTAHNPAPFTYIITVMSGTPSPGFASPSTEWRVNGAYLNVQGEVYAITDLDGNVLAMVHTFGTVITRADATAGT